MYVIHGFMLVSPWGLSMGIYDILQIEEARKRPYWREAISGK